MNIRALVLATYGGADAAAIATMPAPTAGPGQVLVRVNAAGVNPLDWKLREGLVRQAFPLQLPAVLGIELAGVVEAVGDGVSALRVGDRVLGAIGGLGAYAELVAVDAAKLSLIPDGMDDVTAASLPVAAITAWQSLNFAGPVRAGQRVLIHGAAGAVGGFATQFAHLAGVTVYATARGQHASYLRELGADVVIDYETQSFEQVVQRIDLVLDYVGGEVLDRSWSVLAPDGVVVGTSSPEILARTPAGRRGLWFMNQPDAARLRQVAEQVARGELSTRVQRVVGLAQLAGAIEDLRSQPHAGKTVVDFTR